MLEIIGVGLNLYKVQEPGVIFHKRDFVKVLDLLKELGYDIEVMKFNRSRHSWRTLYRYLAMGIPLPPPLPPPTLERKRC